MSAWIVLGIGIGVAAGFLVGLAFYSAALGPMKCPVCGHLVKVTPSDEP